jgi:sulfur-oxidizing protein SoxY
MQLKKLVRNTLVVAMGGLIGATAAYVNVASAEVAKGDFAITKNANHMTVNSAIKRVFGDAKIETARSIKIKAPNIAEEGPEVPIKVHPNMKNVEEVTIFASGNKNPLIARYKIPRGTAMVVGARIKLRKESNVVAVIKANGKLYKTSRFVKVTKGGCGG